MSTAPEQYIPGRILAILKLSTQAIHNRSKPIILLLTIVLTILNSMYASAQDHSTSSYPLPVSKVEEKASPLNAEPHTFYLAPRGRWGDGSQRYAPARFTYRAPIPEEKPPVLIATKPLPSNRPNPKPHAKGYKGYLKRLHSVQSSVRKRFPFKLKIKSSLGAYGKKNGKVRPLTYETADFNWKSKYKNFKFLHREDRR
ncbi:hypothetical protein BCV69DRAFT_298253 [Microstroma glucosiphilum]|uniref:Uncharacterized protein n=1 Tax=Pseudomicrostroma glucosiphilum TaxID=1684307 RepID=A0A316UA03_9BASI|nr:hypothetical protein BCV69DRAFT_298253 [Pseudomicrostroma glucosiphilum]PWN22060.1 hypothetical protein BCV69DRAFT_298253 [Pseudomicrostroma glucosiphilum]